ncbi:MAG: hypothetical protein P4L99_28130 [Chthoniobacter sp.]|nr:hypothetical protein [Chthoniobacter sp.]
MPALLVNGVHLILDGITGTAGDKNGVAKLNVRVNVPDIVTALTLSPNDVATALGISGLICTDRPLSQDPDGEFTVTFQLEGFNQTWDFTRARDFMQLSWKPIKSQDPIETHPHYKDFAATYGPRVDGQWPETYTPKAGTGSPGFAQGSSKSVPNPFLGTDSWFKYGGTFSRTYAVTSVPANVWQNHGVLIDFPPDADLLGIPFWPNRKWLTDVPEIDPVGSAFRITENYSVTGITNGAEAIIYAEAQLSASK